MAELDPVLEASLDPEEAPPVVTACVICLKAVVIHIDGADFSTIAFSRRVRNILNPGEQLQILADFNVPTGSERSFQILALYLDSSTKELKLQYGSTISNIANPDEYIDVKMDILNDATGSSDFKLANLNGRYLTTSDAGPTGEVKVFYSHKGLTNMKLFFGRGEIINGWFSFFASENFPLTYKMAGTGEVLFDKQNTDALTTGTTIAIMKKPSNFWSKVGAQWYNSYQPGSVVYGYFGPGVTTQGVVIENPFGQDVATAMDKMSYSDGGNLLNFHYKQSDTTGVAIDVYGVGGLPLSSSSLLGQSHYNTNRINITLEQFNGKGHYARNGIQGAFTSFTESPSSAYYRFKTTFNVGGDAATVVVKALPGLFDGPAARYESVRLFMKTGFSDSNQAANCAPAWLFKNGFQEISFTSVNVDPASLVIDFTFPYVAARVTQMHVLCPTLPGGETDSLGAMFLGPIIQ
jgi:hypothetical protein